jgi:hypothetical protein
MKGIFMVDCKEVLKKCKEVLKTQLQKGASDELLEKRKKRIEEALRFPSGTNGSPVKNHIQDLPNGKEAFFLKPGKEAFRKKNLNPNDMKPIVGSSKDESMLSFDKIFENILKVSLHDEDSFKKILVLIYRLAYMLDCRENEDKVIRYLPSKEIANCIDCLDTEIKKSFPDYDLWGLLYFLDLLGWNEDVKYHVENGKPVFNEKSNFDVGRINTLLSCIGVPYLAYQFVKHVLDNKDDPKKIEHVILVDIIQRLLKSRGICKPKQKEIVDWLKPYVWKP